MRTSVIRLIEVTSLGLIALIAAILFGGTGGGIGHLSPETLVFKSRKQYLFARSTEYRHKLADYLIEKGYWSPDTTKTPHGF
jgi:hypothetical protein